MGTASDVVGILLPASLSANLELFHSVDRESAPVETDAFRRDTSPETHHRIAWNVKGNGHRTGSGMYVAVAWSQIAFYYIKLSGTSARSAMLLTSFRIMRDYFPIGTGFGTYASHGAAVNYSPVYAKYGFELIYELRNASTGTFFDDQFWPIIFGQTGVLGTVCYLYYLFQLFIKIKHIRIVNAGAYVACLFLFLYLLVSSTAEPAFNNSIAVPMACVLGGAFKLSQNCSQLKTNSSSN